MEPAEIAKAIAKGGNVKLVSDRANHVYRVWREDETAIVKVYASQSRERREKRALDALGGVHGIPRVLGRKSDAEHPWVVFADAGSWSLATLTGNLDAAGRAGEVLRGIHDADPGDLTNLSGGMDADTIAADFVTTFQRLGRYRRKLQIAPDVFQAAEATAPPQASEARAAHTRPGTESFIVSENGQVTLVGWGWATLAPPEWDLSYASWRVGIDMGEAGMAAFQEGYGRDMATDQYDAWIAYHSAQSLLHDAETQEGRLDHLREIVATLEAALAGSG
ncbi:MAG: aminoglycoside phosphotransferase family protein [Acidimicrobiia bacterium]